MSVEAGCDFTSSCSFYSNHKALSFFSLHYFVCVNVFSGRFDHVTSYFGFSCNGFDRLLCAGGKVCGLL